MAMVHESKLAESDNASTQVTDFINRSFWSSTHEQTNNTIPSTPLANTLNLNSTLGRLFSEALQENQMQENHSNTNTFNPK